MRIMKTLNRSSYDTRQNTNTITRTMRLILPIIICSVGLFLTSCGGSTTGTNGGGGSDDGSGGGGSSIGTDPTFSNVQQIFQQSCGGGGCHINTTTKGVKLDTYDNVMNSEGTQYGKLVVQPDSADASPLVDKIEANPKYGARMPKGGSYLSDSRIQQIRDWINNGAKDN